MAGLALAWLPGWVLGVAWQLQQAALWPWQGYAALLLANGLLMAGLLWRGSRGGRPAAWVLVLAVAAGAWAGAGLTGVRAAHFASQALDPALQGLDIEVTGRIHSMPRRHAEGAHHVQRNGDVQLAADGPGRLVAGQVDFAAHHHGHQLVVAAEIARLDAARILRVGEGHRAAAHLPHHQHVGQLWIILFDGFVDA